MRLLVLGGTVFLGRHVVNEALEQGHDVTVFTRGVHPVPGAVDHRTGDRAGDISALDTGEWDHVIDTSGYEAADVGRLAGRPLRVRLQLQRLPRLARGGRGRGLARVGERR
jgi:nucleoside-diphosphate-sugar epimerase